jgi:histidine triad (HIT) family protein
VSDRLICDEVSERVLSPGGLLGSGDLFVTIHAPPVKSNRMYLGHLLVLLRRHVADFADMTDAEVSEVGRAMQLWSNKLRALGASRVYVAVAGHGVAHVHVNLLPRWPETPDEISWYAVDEWPRASVVDFVEATSFAERLRTA